MRSATPARTVSFFFSIILAASLLTSCERTPGASPPPKLPIVPIEDVPAPKTLSVTMERGSNLRTVAAAAYGHERFSGFVARVNGISDPERVAAGAVLKTPSLSAALRDAGADPAMQPALNALAKACTDYYAVEPSYLAARRASGVRSGTFPIPPEIKQKFIACAETIDAAVNELSSVRPPHNPPKMAIGQFRQVAGQIRELAGGAIDGYGYDSDLVGQRFGIAFTNALIWTQQQHR